MQYGLPPELADLLKEKEMSLEKWRQELLWKEQELETRAKSITPPPKAPPAVLQQLSTQAKQIEALQHSIHKNKNGKQKEQDLIEWEKQLRDMEEVLRVHQEKLAVKETALLARENATVKLEEVLKQQEDDLRSQSDLLHRKLELQEHEELLLHKEAQVKKIEEEARRRVPLVESALEDIEDRERLLEKENAEQKKKEGKLDEKFQQLDKWEAELLKLKENILEKQQYFVEREKEFEEREQYWVKYKDDELERYAKENSAELLQRWDEIQDMEKQLQHMEANLQRERTMIEQEKIMLKELKAKEEATLVAIKEKGKRLEQEISKQVAQTTEAEEDFNLRLRDVQDREARVTELEDIFNDKQKLLQLSKEKEAQLELDAKKLQLRQNVMQELEHQQSEERRLREAELNRQEQILQEIQTEIALTKQNLQDEEEQLVKWRSNLLSQQDEFNEREQRWIHQQEDKLAEFQASQARLDERQHDVEAKEVQLQLDIDELRAKEDELTKAEADNVDRAKQLEVNMEQQLREEQGRLRELESYWTARAAELERCENEVVGMKSVMLQQTNEMEEKHKQYNIQVEQLLEKERHAAMLLAEAQERSHMTQVIKAQVEGHIALIQQQISLMKTNIENEQRNPQQLEGAEHLQQREIVLIEQGNILQQKTKEIEHELHTLEMTAVQLQDKEKHIQLQQDQLFRDHQLTVDALNARDEALACKDASLHELEMQLHESKKQLQDKSEQLHHELLHSREISDQLDALAESLNHQKMMCDSQEHYFSQHCDALSQQELHLTETLEAQKLKIAEREQELAELDVQLTSLDQQLEERRLQINTKVIELDKRENEITIKERQLRMDKQHAMQVLHWEEGLQHKKLEMDSMARSFDLRMLDLQTKESQLAARIERIKVKEAEIDRLRTELTDKETELDAWQTQLNQKETNIFEDAKSVSAAQAKKHDELQVYERHIREKQSEFSVVSKEFQSQKMQWEEQRAQFNKLQQQNAQEQSYIEQSLSCMKEKERALDIREKEFAIKLAKAAEQDVALQSRLDDVVKREKELTSKHHDLLAMEQSLLGKERDQSWRDLEGETAIRKKQLELQQLDNEFEAQQRDMAKISNELSQREGMLNQEEDRFRHLMRTKEREFADTQKQLQEQERGLVERQELLDQHTHNVESREERCHLRERDFTEREAALRAEEKKIMASSTNLHQLQTFEAQLLARDELLQTMEDDLRRQKQAFAAQQEKATSVAISQQEQALMREAEAATKFKAAEDLYHEFQTKQQQLHSALDSREASLANQASELANQEARMQQHSLDLQQREAHLQEAMVNMELAERSRVIATPPPRFIMSETEMNTIRIHKDKLFQDAQMELQQMHREMCEQSTRQMMQQHHHHQLQLSGIPPHANPQQQCRAIIGLAAFNSHQIPSSISVEQTEAYAKTFRHDLTPPERANVRPIDRSQEMHHPHYHPHHQQQQQPALQQHSHHHTTEYSHEASVVVGPTAPPPVHAVVPVPVAVTQQHTQQHTQHHTHSSTVLQQQQVTSGVGLHQQQQQQQPQQQQQGRSPRSCSSTQVSQSSSDATIQALNSVQQADTCSSCATQHTHTQQQSTHTIVHNIQPQPQPHSTTTTTSTTLSNHSNRHSADRSSTPTTPIQHGYPQTQTTSTHTTSTALKAPATVAVLHIPMHPIGGAVVPHPSQLSPRAATLQACHAYNDLCDNMNDIGSQRGRKMSDMHATALLEAADTLLKLISAFTPSAVIASKRSHQEIVSVVEKVMKSQSCALTESDEECVLHAANILFKCFETTATTPAVHAPYPAPMHCTSPVRVISHPQLPSQQSMMA